MTEKRDIATLATRVITTIDAARDDIRSHETRGDGLAILSHLDIAAQQLATLRQHVSTILVTQCTIEN